MNNSVKSVSPSPSKSKASDQRQTRQDSYRKKFNKPHVIIPIEDLAWIEDQPNSVKTLFINCWMSDPYGSRLQVLNHSLTKSSFKRAKKILANKGLFIFKRDYSILDGREIACWMVMNLHGARRKDFWLSLEVNLEGQERASKVHERPMEDHERPIEGHGWTATSIETQTQQGLQNPSVTSQEAPQKLLKEVSGELRIESEVGDRHRQSAFDERIDSAPPQDEQKKAVTFSLDKKSQIKESRENPDPIKDSSAPLEKTISYNPLSDEAIKITNAENLRIEAQQKTEEYQSISKEALARIRANLAKKQERMDAERRAKDWEASPMSLMDSQNVEELKREKEAERWQEEALEESPPESLRNDRVINRPAPEDYPDDW